MIFKKFVYMIFALGLLLLMSNSRAESKDFKLELQDLNNIDLCGKEFQKEVIIAPSLGNLLRSDSLIGFELSLSYDPDVVKMNRILTINTHADRFEYTQSFVDGEIGEIVFEGAIDLQGFPTPLSGDRPLVGFAGNFIGECVDTTVFRVNYFFAYDEFNGNVDVSDELVISGDIVDKPSRTISFAIENEDIKLKKDSSALVDINLDLGEMSSLEHWRVKAVLSSDSVTISNVLGNSSIEVKNVTDTNDNGYYIELKVKDNSIPKFNIEFSSFKYDSSDIELTLETVETTECICATNFPSYKAGLNNLQSVDTTSSVETIIDESLFYNGQIVPLYKPVTVDIYNVIGSKVDSQVCNINDVYDLNRLRKGIYIIKVTTDNVTKIYKKINN